MSTRKMAVLVAAVLLALPVAGAVPVRADEDGESFDLPSMAGWVMSPDNRTLIVSTGSAGELVYYDTVASKEGKHVELEFQPTCLAVQGDTLIAGAKGSAVLHLLDLATGKEKSTIKVAAPGLQTLACHPTQGLIYGATKDGVIYSVDLKTAKATKTSAVGTMLVVDPVEAKAVYAGTQTPIRDRLLITSAGGRTTFRVIKSGIWGSLVKYRVTGKGLTASSINTQAVINARSVAVSPDGKFIAMAGGGGLEGEDRKHVYDIPVYTTSKLQEMQGQIEVGAFPNNVAFHPVLSLGVAEQAVNGGLLIFKSKSFAKVKSLKPHKTPTTPGPTLLTFGGQGTKIIYGIQVGLRGKETAKLYFIPLELTEEQQKELKTAYPSSSAAK